ncbi:MAG TPA: GNAT family N-acetyltransferase [Chthoniobacterales bacterium]
MNIRLREVEPGDLPLFFAHQHDAEAAAMAAFPSRDRAAFDQHWAKTLANPANMLRTVIVDGEIAGNVCSFTRDGLREVGYWIDRAYWGRGVATAALTAYLRLEQTRPLYAGVAQHNAASIRVLQKCGFTVMRSDDGEPLVANDAHVLLVLASKEE